VELTAGTPPRAEGGPPPIRGFQGRTLPLAKDKVYEFMFVLGQPRYTGAVQAIINPVAIR